MRRRHQQRLERLRARARRRSRRAPPPCRPSPRRRARSTRPGTAPARPSSAASRGRTTSISSGARDLRRDAAQQQPPAAPLAVVGAQQRLGLVDRRAGAVARAVVDEAHLRRAAPATSSPNAGVDLQHDVEVAGANLGLVVGRRGDDRHLLSLEERDQRRRVLAAGDGQRQVARLVGLARDQVEDQQQEDRAGGDRRQRASPASCAGRATRSTISLRATAASARRDASVASRGEAFAGAEQRDEGILERRRARAAR